MSRKSEHEKERFFSKVIVKFLGETYIIVNKANKKARPVFSAGRAIIKKVLKNEKLFCYSN